MSGKKKAHKRSTHKLFENAVNPADNKSINHKKILIFWFEGEHMNFFVSSTSQLSQGQPDPDQSKRLIFMCGFSLKLLASSLGNVSCQWSGKKRHINIDFWSAFAWDEPRVCPSPKGKPRFSIILHSGSPLCPWVKSNMYGTNQCQMAAETAHVLKVYVPFSLPKWHVRIEKIQCMGQQ